MQPHEYSIIGHSRASIGRHLGTLSGIIASMVAAAAMIVWDIGARLGLSSKVPEIVLFPFSTAVVFPLGHMAFDKWFWKVPLLRQALGIPDLNGTWRCEGTTITDTGEAKYSWSGTVTIHQTWEKIWVYLDTGTSCSRSVAASLIKEPGRGYILMYSYRNEPRVGDPELKPHIGYCELHLDEELTRAQGDYFNNRGRVTHGRMTLTRTENMNGC